MPKNKGFLLDSLRKVSKKLTIFHLNFYLGHLFLLLNLEKLSFLPHSKGKKIPLWIMSSFINFFTLTPSYTIVHNSLWFLVHTQLLSTLVCSYFLDIQRWRQQVVLNNRNMDLPPPRNLIALGYSLRLTGVIKADSLRLIRSISTIHGRGWRK